MNDLLLMMGPYVVDLRTRCRTALCNIFSQSNWVSGNIRVLLDIDHLSMSKFTTVSNDNLFGSDNYSTTMSRWKKTIRRRKVEELFILYGHKGESSLAS